MVFGRILSIDLTEEKCYVEKIDISLIKAFIGGKGLGAYLLYRSLKGNEDPLSPENPIFFLTGPLTGTSFPTSGRCVVVSKSPLTGIFSDSHMGGYFGPELRKVGYDGIVIRGKSQEPKYIYINDDGVEFKDAGELWGLPVDETITNLRKKTHAKAHIACIGPAGENLVRVSGIMVDKDNDPLRAGIAARGGLGAVMGSKNLKAIAVKGSKTIDLFDKNKFKEVSMEAFENIKKDVFIPKRKKFGTSYWVEPMNRLGILPTRNFQQGFIQNGEKLYSTYMCSSFLDRNVTCFSCPIRCGKVLGLEETQVKVEYESIALLGSNNGITDVKEVAKAVALCNNMGLDTISTGNIIGFAMECSERRILPDAPGFGDAEGQLELIKNIAYKEGIGEILAQGVKKASAEIGEESARSAMHVKGMEIPGYEPRSSWGMALAYATADRGACHQRAWTVSAEINGVFDRFAFNSKAEFVKEIQDERAAAYSILVCDFVPVNLENLTKAIQYATGIRLSEEEYLQTGERIWNMARMFNVREGLTVADDTLPDRFFEDPLPLPPGLKKSSVRLSKAEFEQALNHYYRLRGWNEYGIPSREKLSELHLTEYSIT